MAIMKFVFAGLMAIIAFSSCRDSENYDVKGNDGIVYARADAGNRYTGLLDMAIIKTVFGVFGTDAKVSFPVRCTMPAKSNIEVSCDIDNSLVKVYNENHKTDYLELDPSILVVANNKLVIKVDSVAGSSRVEVTLNKENIKNIQLGDYLIPIKLSVRSGSMAVSQKLNTIYVHLNVGNDISSLDLPYADRSKWKVESVSSEETVGENAPAKNAIDDNISTFWHTYWYEQQPKPPHWIVIDMGEEVKFAGFEYLTRSTGRGVPTALTLYVSLDNTNWTQIATYGKGELPTGGKVEVKKVLDKAYPARYFKLYFTDSNEYFMSLQDLNAYTAL